MIVMSVGKCRIAEFSGFLYDIRIMRYAIAAMSYLVGGTVLATRVLLSPAGARSPLAPFVLYTSIMPSHPYRGIVIPSLALRLHCYERCQP